MLDNTLDPFDSSPLPPFSVFSSNFTHTSPKHTKRRSIEREREEEKMGIDPCSPFGLNLVRKSRRNGEEERGAVAGRLT